MPLEAMSAPLEAATTGVAYTRPLPFVRRASDRRIEVFSPKLERRLSLTSYPAWQLWLALEANPTVSTFCERPAFIEGTPRRTIDFWVRYNPQGGYEFWLLDDAEQSADLLTIDAMALPILIPQDHELACKRLAVAS